MVDVLDALRELLGVGPAAARGSAFASRRQPQQPGEKTLVEPAQVVELLAQRRNVAASELCVKISALGFYIQQLFRAWSAEREAVRALRDAAQVRRQLLGAAAHVPLCGRCCGRAPGTAGRSAPPPLPPEPKRAPPHARPPAVRRLRGSGSRRSRRRCRGRCSSGSRT